MAYMSRGKTQSENRNAFEYKIVYQTTHKASGKIYIGKHATDDLNDGYLGSGTTIKRAIKKYGPQAFDWIILKEFNTYEECSEYEAEIVTEEFINLKNNYNEIVGGQGGKLSDANLASISIKQTQHWANNKDEIMAKRFADGHYEKTSASLKGLKKSDDHVNKINRNPEKIRKTAEKHRGMKRSDTTKENMSISKKKFIEENGTEYLGKGMIYITDGQVSVRHDPTMPIPLGWLKGMPKRSIFVNNGTEEKRHKVVNPIPTGWIEGKIQKQIHKDFFWITNGYKITKHYDTSTIPNGWVIGHRVVMEELRRKIENNK